MTFNSGQTLQSSSLEGRVSTLEKLGKVGGKRWSTGGTFVAGISTAEGLTNMDTGPVTLTPGRSYRLHTRFLCIANGASLNYWYMRVRRGGLTGTQVGEYVFTTQTNSYGMSQEFSVDFPDIGAVAITDTWYLTAAKLSGPDGLNINKGSAVNTAHMFFADEGPISKITAL